jgi:hypothetical protein
MTITNGATATTSFGLLDKFLLFRVALFMASNFKFISPGVLTSDPYSTHSSYDYDSLKVAKCLVI